jgi:hypothetical protein
MHVLLVSGQAEHFFFASESSISSSLFRMAGGSLVRWKQKLVSPVWQTGQQNMLPLMKW